MGQKFLIAAFCCTWIIQLGYLLSLVAKWQGQRRHLLSQKSGNPERF